MTLESLTHHRVIPVEFLIHHRIIPVESLTHHQIVPVHYLGAVVAAEEDSDFL